MVPALLFRVQSRSYEQAQPLVPAAGGAGGRTRRVVGFMYKAR
jgi:hypothetical protein